MGKPAKWILAWDFPTRGDGARSRAHSQASFYNVCRDEFRSSEVERVQKSVAIAADDFTARRFRALLEYYGANVLAYAIDGLSLDDASADREAEEYIERVHADRLHKRGRHPTLKGGRSCKRR